jgi:hypothetical protein
VAPQRDKRPKPGFIPQSGKKQPKADESLARAYRDQNPVWKFARHAKGGAFAWTSLESEDLPRVFNALAGFEGMRWSDIENKDHCHEMGVDRCHEEIGTHLAQQGHDVDVLFQLSTGNKGRIFGIRTQHVLEIVFWDRDHDVYATKKKNT